MRLSRIFLPAFVIVMLVIGHCSFATAKEFDGIWFLGFNTRAVPFNQLAVRQAVAHTLDRQVIISGLASDEGVPASYIPPGLTGFDPNLQPYKHNLAYAKALMKKAGFPPNKPELKNISLLHTDGVKTIEIAKQVQKELKQLGLKIERQQIRYYDNALWESELRSGRHQLFLMGYKEESDQSDSVKLLGPLFSSTGEANFTGYSQADVDVLLERLALIDPSLAGERTAKLLEVNRQIYRDLPALILFYIEKI
ncbi:MAG: ABC transporter substrate-binding protein [Candidatus Margulisiibacteriota bacterium]